MINKIGKGTIDHQLTQQEIEVARALIKHWQAGGNQPLGIIARVVSQCSAALRLKLQCDNTQQAVYKAKSQGLLD